MKKIVFQKNIRYKSAITKPGISGVILLGSILCMLLTNSYAQKLNISGRILDSESKKALVGAEIIHPVSGKGSLTDEDGYFRLVLNEEIPLRLRISYMGYQGLDTLFRVKSKSFLIIYLKPVTHALQEATITAETTKDMVNSNSMGEINLESFEILHLKGIMGESDPVKLLQLTPGVQSGNEAGTGIFVRGGNADQNLIMLNNALVYNPGHLMGFFSVFNPDLIREVNLMKSGIPARYGQRLSSVIKVKTINGRSDSLRGVVESGLISSRMSLYRSFNKDKGSVYMGLRRTYFDLIVKPVLKSIVGNTFPQLNDSKYFFQDFNLGGSYRIGNRDQLSLNMYGGNDKYQYNNGDVNLSNFLQWGNMAGSLEWNHSFSKDAGLSLLFSATDYNFTLEGGQSLYNFQLYSEARDMRMKAVYSKEIPGGRIYAGADATGHRYIPNRIDVEAGDFIFDFLTFQKLYSVESAVFADFEYELKRFSFLAGLRFSAYSTLGPYTRYEKDEMGAISDSSYHPSGEIIDFFCEPEPRLSLKYQINPVSSVKASYMRTVQYVHLATSSSVSLPMDIWLPASGSFKPQIASQVSLGYYHKFDHNAWQFSTEVYYKQSRNQLEFIRGIINNSLNMTLEENIASGEGYSMGSEFFLRKNQGPFTGWLSYTLSGAYRKFDELNEGKIYPAKFDRRHDISLALIRKLNEKWFGSLIWVYTSGNALTIPRSRYIIQGNLVNEYGEVNGFRMPAYHRMDISFTREKHHPNGIVTSWNFSVFNVYNRANPFYIYFETKSDEQENKLEVSPGLVSLFPIIPSVSWNIKF